jgi:polyhydroxybutyrate depolymerase
MINGTDDRKVPWRGGSLPYGRILSVPASIDFWRQQNQCSGAAKVRSLNPRVQIDQYANCKNGAEVELVTLKGAGHLFPRGGGGANSLINAGQEIWNFFDRHRSN